MFDANNISASYMYVRHFRLEFRQAGSKITLTPSRYQIHLITVNVTRTFSAQKRQINYNIQPQAEKHYSCKRVDYEK